MVEVVFQSSMISLFAITVVDLWRKLNSIAHSPHTELILTRSRLDAELHDC